MHEQIKTIKEKAESIGSEKIRLEEETKNLRAKRQEELQQLKEMQEDLLNTQNKTAQRKIDLENCEDELVECKENLSQMKKKQAQQVKKIHKSEGDRETRSETLSEKRKALDVIEHELGLVEKEYKKLLKEREYTVNKKLEILNTKRENEITQETLKLDNELKQEEFTKLKKLVEEIKKDID